jgi:hypothetical protein
MTRARDLATGILPGVWTSYTPTFRTGADTKTATINYAKYIQIGKTLFVQVRLTSTATGTTNSKISVSLPAGFTYQNNHIFATHGSFTILDSGTAIYTGAAVVENSYVYGTGYGSVDNMGANTPAMTIISNDMVSFNITVEVA